MDLNEIEISSSTSPPLTTDESDTPMNVNERNVNIAVRFLNNKNVRTTSKEQKMNFLKSKGLNDEEIQLAMEKVDEAEAEECDDDCSSSSAWSIWDYLKYFVLGAGVLSSANYAYKAYVLPYVAHEMKDDARIEALNESVQFLKDDLKQNTYEFTCTLKSIQGLLEEQKTLLTNIESKLNNVNGNQSSLDDIKGDLSTLKSMMLKNNQFPPAPFIGGTAMKTMEIPAWQKASEQTKAPPEEVDPEENQENEGVVST